MHLTTANAQIVKRTKIRQQFCGPRSKSNDNKLRERRALRENCAKKQKTAIHENEEEQEQQQY